MARLVAGLDIGVASVGYGVIDLDTKEFVDYGVRLFDEGKVDNNLKRRTSRGRRRLLRRKQTRIQDMQKLLEANGIYDGTGKNDWNIYELRCKGLTNKLSNSELTAVLLNLAKHRGSSLDVVEEDADSSDEESAKAVLVENQKALSTGKYICQVQLERLHNKGKIRGNTNNFKTSDYVNEATEILNHQDLSEELIQKIVSVISRKREYYDGPGSEKSPTPYGQYFFDEKGVLQHVGMIEKMKGKCSVYPNEYRAPKMSASAEIFNMLNDLNNLTIEGRKLETEEKKAVFSIISKKGSITLKQIAKELKVDEDSIEGYRIDKNGKAIFTEFKGYKEIRKIFENHSKEISLNDYELLDKIATILTDKKGVNDRNADLSKIGIDENIIDDLAQSTKFTGYHALSFKAINMLNIEMYNSDRNQMQILYEIGAFGTNRESMKGKKNIVADEEAILSPVAKRAQHEAIKVLNALRKKYGELDSVVIEMTRAKNSKEEKKQIEDLQKYLENRNKEVDKLLKDRGFDPDSINGKTKLKIKLYLEQDCKSPYTGEAIDLRRLINDPTYTEIDHIIPLSVSLDDSQSNKVVVLRSENQDKGQRTPLMAIRSSLLKTQKGVVINEADYVERIKNCKNFNRKKTNYLLFQEDITKYDVIKQFLNRNLVDTGYACRTVLNTLQNYYKDNNIPTKVFTINGKVTNKFRTQINLPKDRDANFLHHAIDALIIASVKEMKLLDGYLSKYNLDKFYDETTGEIKEQPEDVPDEKAFFDAEYIAYIVQLKNIYEESVKYYQYERKADELLHAPIKISYKVDTKPNRSIADETIYSTRMKKENGVTVTDKNGDSIEMLTEKIKDIYSTNKNDQKGVARVVNGIINDDSQLLMKQNDPQTYEILKEVVMSDFNMYKESEEHYKNGKKGYELVGDNPFATYKEKFGAIHKYSKKGNGPEIKSVRLYKEVLGNHLDISHKYKPHDKKVVSQSISAYRTDFYLCGDNKYRFVTVRYKDVKSIHNHYVIDKDWYLGQKTIKGIHDEDEFVCSLHHNELLKIQRKMGDTYIFDPSKNDKEYTAKIYQEGDFEILQFTATNNDKVGTVQVKPRYCKSKPQLMPVAATFTMLQKMATDVLGNLYEVKDNVLKLEF